MKIGSVFEDQNLEKRISITPEIAKKYISLGFDVILSENYGVHLGIKDDEYKELGVNIQKDENQIIKSAKSIICSSSKIFTPNFLYSLSKKLK